MMHETPLPLGYHPLPPGHLANVVTCLEMTEKPSPRAVPDVAGLSLQRMGAADTERFRALFAAIGRDFLWFSRLILEEEKLAAIIGDPKVVSLALVKEGRDIGLLELDFREEGPVRTLLLRRRAGCGGHRRGALADERGGQAGLG